MNKDNEAHINTSEASFEALFSEARSKHEEGMDPRIIALDRKGEWLHKNWFRLGIEAERARSKGLVEALEKEIHDSHNESPCYHMMILEEALKAYRGEG